MNGNDAFQQLIGRLRKFRDDRGWGQFHTPKDLAISVSIEAAELLQLFQWEATDKPIDSEMKAGIAGEVADILLYLLMFCEVADIDILGAAASKIEINEARYPVERSYGIAKPPRAE